MPRARVRDQCHPVLQTSVGKDRAEVRRKEGIDALERVTGTKTDRQRHEI